MGINDHNENLWKKLKARIMDEWEHCSEGQYCVGKDTYIDATARMEAYDHVLKIMRELETSTNDT